MGLGNDGEPGGAYEFDVWLGLRPSISGIHEDLGNALYRELTARSLRVFYAPISLGDRTVSNGTDWDRKYLLAAANTVSVVFVISRATFAGPSFDMARYVWSSKSDTVLLEWDLMLELHNKGRVKTILPVLVGDLTSALQMKSQQKVLVALGITALEEKAVVSRLRSLFKYADADNSGFIDKGELRVSFQRFGLNIQEEELSDMYDEADADGGSGIDLFEFEDMIFSLIERKCGSQLRGVQAAPGAKKDAPKKEDPARAALKGGAIFTTSKQRALIEKQKPPMSPGSEDGSPVSKAHDDLNRFFFTNFFGSGVVPELPRVIMSQSVAKLSSWLRLQLGYESSQVLWRAVHTRGLPCVDADNGGRTIAQSTAAILGFRAHLVEGDVNMLLEQTCSEIEKSWRECVKIPANEWKETGERPICLATNREARFRDPITDIPFYDTDVFRNLRQHHYFDFKKCHETIIMENNGTRVTYSGQGGHSVLLSPQIAAKGTSYVEFFIHLTGLYTYLFFGVCDGSYDVHGGWRANSDLGACLYCAFNGKKVIDGVYSDFGEDRAGQGDRVGLLVDMDRGELQVLVNDIPQGILTDSLPKPLYFCVDMGWPGQSIETVQRTHWQMLSQNIVRHFEGLSPEKQIAKMQELFNEFDEDRQGTIDADEFRAALENLHVHLSDEELKELMDEVDQDGSGDIDFGEFAHMIRRVQQKHSEGEIKVRRMET